MYHLLVTGGRDLPEAEIVWVPLWILLHQKKSIIVTHGMCESGADYYAHEWFQLPEQSFNRDRRLYEPKVEYLAIEDPHPALWNVHGKAAGPIRNQEMVDTDPKPDCCFAFPTPKSSGTLDCIARCWVAGIKTYIFHHLDVGQFHILTDEEGEHLARKKLHWGCSV